MIAQVEFGMLGSQPHRVLHLALREAVAVAQQRAELSDEGLNPIGAIVGPFDHEFMAARANGHAEEVFEPAEVVVVGAEEDVDALVGNRDGTGGRGSDS